MEKDGHMATIPNSVLLDYAQAGKTVAELLDDMLADTSAQIVNIDAAINARKVPAIAKVSEPVKRTRDGSGQRKVYVLLRIAKGKHKGEPSVDVSDLPASYRRVWQYMLKHETGDGVES